MNQTQFDESGQQQIVPLAYTPIAAAQVASRTRTRIYQAIKTGELTARKDGKATLIERDELARWIQNMPVINRKTDKAA